MTHRSRRSSAPVAARADEDEGRPEEEDFVQHVAGMVSRCCPLDERCTKEPGHEKLLGLDRECKNEGWKDNQNLRDASVRYETRSAESSQADRRRIERELRGTAWKLPSSCGGRERSRGRLHAVADLR